MKRRTEIHQFLWRDVREFRRFRPSPESIGWSSSAFRKSASRHEIIRAPFTGEITHPVGEKWPGRDQIYKKSSFVQSDPYTHTILL